MIVIIEHRAREGDCPLLLCWQTSLSLEIQRHLGIRTATSPNLLVPLKTRKSSPAETNCNVLMTQFG